MPNHLRRGEGTGTMKRPLLSLAALLVLAAALVGSHIRRQNEDGQDRSAASPPVTDPEPTSTVVSPVQVWANRHTISTKSPDLIGTGRRYTGDI